MSWQAPVLGFDFHCHVDLHPDPAVMMERCEKEKIVVIAVTTTPKAWPQNCKWAAKNAYVYPAVGLHPELVTERYAEADLLVRHIRDSRFVGEVGLDGSPQHQKIYRKQQEIFSRILDTSQKLAGRVLSIHSRRAARDVVAMIEKQTKPENVLCILHWFSGSVSEAQKAVAAGCYFSVNQAMLAHERGQKLVSSLPINRILTETDSPFTLIKKQPSMPWDVIVTTINLAKVCGESTEQMQSILNDNARRVFKFAGIGIPGA